MAAIQMINQSLNDPVKAISDETFSAVCRLLAFEVSGFFPKTHSCYLESTLLTDFILRRDIGAPKLLGDYIGRA